MKAISVLGSTGSIGTQTLEIVDDFPDQFRVVALSAGRNLSLLVSQIQRHRPDVVALADPALLAELKDRLMALPADTRPEPLPQLVGGPEGLDVVASWDAADLVVTGIVGCAIAHPGGDSSRERPRRCQQRNIDCRRSGGPA